MIIRMLISFEDILDDDRIIFSVNVAYLEEETIPKFCLGSKEE